MDFHERQVSRNQVLNSPKDAGQEERGRGSGDGGRFGDTSKGLHGAVWQFE